MDVLSFISLFGGLAIFLYGMNVLGTGLEKLSGGRLEHILESFTSNILGGVLLGALVTAAVQSSSATTVIVVGLVNAGILKLRPAIGVIMGANIGTTVTAHILRLTTLDTDHLLLRFLKPSTLAPLMAIIGVILFMTSKRSSHRNVGQLLLGFGVLFTGMFQMEDAVRPLRDMPQFAEMFATLQNPVLGVLTGATVTALIQSSSASVGILQALSSTGAITFSSAFPIIMGQNIGTCVTPMMASIGASRNAKRAAFVHLTFNILGTLLFLVGTYAYQNIVGFAFWQDAIDSGGIANFHTLFNVVVTLLFIPFAGLLEKIVYILFKKTDSELAEIRDVANLDDRIMLSPGLAVDHAEKAALSMGEKAFANLRLASELFKKFDQKTLERIVETENTIDRMEDRMENYLVELSKRELNTAESRRISDLLHIIGEFEHIGDQAESIAMRAQSLHNEGISFSSGARQELALVFEAVDEIVGLSLSAYGNDDYHIASHIEPLEEVIDQMEETLKGLHIKRLQSGKCSIEAAFPFVETIAALEKVSDYCSNIGVVMLAKQEQELHHKTIEHHDYLHRLHKGDTPDYTRHYNEYKEKYLPRLSKINE